MSNELERVARALNLAGWTCSDGAHEPGNYDTCAQCRRVCNNGAHIAIAALTPTPQVVETPCVVEGDGYCRTHSRYHEDDGVEQAHPALDVDVLAEVRAFATQSAIAARASGTSEAERRWLDLLIILDRAEGK